MQFLIRRYPLYLNLAILLGSSTVTIGNAAGALPVPEFVAKIERSVVLIEVPGISLGSGFVIDRNGTVATNYHVIEGAKRVNIVFNDKTKTKATGYRIFSKGMDIALLVAADVPDHASPLPLAADKPKKGETVYAFGAPRGFDGSVSDGLVSGNRLGTELQKHLMFINGVDVYTQELEFHLDTEWIQTTCPISGGNSGGPLVNAKGHVVGVNTLSIPLGQNLNFAVSATQVASLLRKAPGNVTPFTELPPTRQKRKAAKGAENTPDAFENRSAALNHDLMIARARYAEWSQVIADFDAKFAELRQTHPARADYDAAHAEARVFQTQITSINAELAGRNRALAIAKAQTGQILSNIAGQENRELSSIDRDYREISQNVEPFELQSLEQSYRDDRRLAQLRYDNLRQQARYRYDQEHARLNSRISELINQRTFITEKNLAGIMAKAMPFDTFLKESNAQRGELVAQLNVLEKDVRKSDNLSRGLPKPIDDDNLAIRKLKLAKLLVFENSISAKHRLAEIIREHPGTLAARKAKALLANMSKGDVLPEHQLDMRQWASNKGDHRVHARMVGFEQDKVHIQKEDGAVVKVSIDRLSESDQQYVRQLFGE